MPRHPHRDLEFLVGLQRPPRAKGTCCCSRESQSWEAPYVQQGNAAAVLGTTKHHDGFCLWDTKLTDFNIMRSPFRRDVVQELAAACKSQGLAVGTYYSTCD